MGELRFFLRGEIDLATINDVAIRLYRASVMHRNDMIVDCMDLEFIGVAGFAMLASLATDFADEGRQLHLAYPSRGLRMMIEVFGADDLVIEPAHPSAVEDERSTQIIPLGVPVARRPPKK